MSKLKGKKVLITRPEAQASEFITILNKSGADPVLLPTIEISASDNKEEQENTIDKLDRYDWIIFTSTNAVHFFFEQANPEMLPEDLNVAAVGKKTKRALEEKGVDTDFMPATFTAEALISGLPLSKAEKVLYPMSEKALKDKLSHILKEKGVVLSSVIFYQNRPLLHPPEKIREIFNRGIDFITFTSGSTTKGLAENLSNANIQLKDEKVICIGPKTAKSAEEAGFRVSGVAEEHTVEGLMRGLIEGC